LPDISFLINKAIDIFDAFYTVSVIQNLMRNLIYVCFWSAFC